MLSLTLICPLEQKVRQIHCSFIISIYFQNSNVDKPREFAFLLHHFFFYVTGCRRIFKITKLLMFWEKLSVCQVWWLEPVMSLCKWKEKLFSVSLSQTVVFQKKSFHLPGQMLSNAIKVLLLSVSSHGSMRPPRARRRTGRCGPGLTAAFHRRPPSLLPPAHLLARQLQHRADAVDLCCACVHATPLWWGRNTAVATL